MSIVRIILAFAASHGWLIHHLDIHNAFLQGDRDEDVYMQLPQGFSNPGLTPLVCKLKTSLYDLKQSFRQWNLKLTNTFLPHDYK